MSTERVDGRSRRYQHRRAELLTAVADFVVEHGISTLAMRPLATAVGVSHGTLLHHFGSKERLVADVIELLRRRLADAVGVTDSAPRVDDLSLWWSASTTADRLPVYRLLFEVYAQAVREPERYERYLQQVVHDSLALVAGLMTAEGCPPEQAPLVASVIVAQARGLQLDLLATDDHERVDRAFELFVRLLTDLKRSWQHSTFRPR